MSYSDDGEFADDLDAEVSDDALLLEEPVDQLSEAESSDDEESPKEKPDDDTDVHLPSSSSADEEDVEITADLDQEHTTDPTMIEIRVVPPDQHQTSDVISATEMANMRGIRATAIERGGRVFGVDMALVTSTLHAVDLEFAARQTPLVIERLIYVEKLPDGREIHHVERKNPREMMYPRK